MKEWLKEVLISKNIDPVPYLKELETNEVFIKNIERTYNIYQEAPDGIKITILLMKHEDMTKLISFTKPIDRPVIDQPVIDQPTYPIDHGKHYRFEYITPLGELVKLDPYFVGKVWGMTSAPLQAVLKKIARSGNGGSKDYEQDLNDCICALKRELELIGEFK